MDSKPIIKVPQQVMRSVLKYVNNRTPIWQATDFYSYVYDAYLKNSDYASIVNFLAEKAASIPWIQEVLVGDDWIVEKDSPILELYECPNPTQGSFEYQVEAYSWFVITGNSYEVCEAPQGGINAGKIQQMWNMPAHLTQVISGGWRKPISKYKVNFDYDEEIDVHKVVHMKRFNPMYHQGQFLQGLPKLASASMELTASNVGKTIEASQLQNGGVPGILTGEDDLDTEAKSWLQNLIRVFSKPEKKGQIPYMNNKGMQYIKLGSELVNLQVLESILKNKQSLCSVHQLSSGLFNDKKGSTYNNKKEEKKDAYLDAILPMVRHRCGEHARFMFPRFYQDGKRRRLRPDTSGIEVLQTELKETASAIGSLRGYLTYGMVYDMLKITPPESMVDMLDEIPQNPAAGLSMPGGIDQSVTEMLERLKITQGEYQKD